MIPALSGRSFPWELIDTLWNVNVADTVSNDGDFRINRYIMECKY